MWLPFFLTHVHFAINIFVALILCAVAWLYFDAWVAKKTFRETCRTLGFFLLAISFALTATQVETSIFGSAILAENLIFWSVLTSRILGYILIIVSHILDPLQPKPSNSAIISPLLLKPVTILISPLLCLFVSLAYLRRATFGLENHLKTVGIAFLLLTISEILTATSTLQNTNQTNLYQLIAPFGPIWIANLIFLFGFSLILHHWVTGYLLKRFSSQLIIAFTSLTLTVFLVTTIAFTFVLLRNLETQNLTQMETDVKILKYALSGQQNTLLSDTQLAAQNPDVIKYLQTKPDRKLLATTLQSLLIAKKQTTSTIVNPSGIIMAKGEDLEKFGGSLPDDKLCKKSLTQGPISTITVTPGAISPIISIEAAVPITGTDNKIIGVILTSSSLDNAFLDNLKSSTGLDASIYGNNLLSATTFTTPDGTNRPLGIPETDPNVKLRVLDQGQPYMGSVNFLGRYYSAAYLPLTNLDGGTTGMLFVGRDQITLLHAAGNAIQTTFMVTLCLLIISLLPSFIISKSISHQIK